jgi:hypothetical protein
MFVLLSRYADPLRIDRSESLLAQPGALAARFGESTGQRREV